jgi:hypothetical protein
MDNCTLSLNNFSSIFELLGTYYILLSLSDKLEEHLGLSAIFRNWHTSFSSDILAKRLSYFKNKISTSQSEIISQIKSQRFWNQIFDSLRNYNSDNDSLQNEVKKTSKFIKKGDMLLAKIKLLTSELSETQHTFSELIKPAYVFSGIAILAVMLISGIVNKWDGKYTNLYFINCSLILVLFLSILQIIRQKPFKIFKGKTLLFVAVIFYLLLTIVPGSLFYFLPLYEYKFSKVICIDDFHILLFLTLIFLPLFIHIISLNILHIRCKKYDTKLTSLLVDELPKKVEGGKRGEIKGVEI